MKNKALAIVLAICMVISMLPMTAFAAPVRKTAQIGAQPRSTVIPAALPELPAEINSGDYKITARVEEDYNNGEIMLYASSADAQEIVYMMVDPDPGYLPGFNGGYSYSEYDMEIIYIGLNLYEIKMPDGDVEFVIGFYPAEGQSHSVTVSAPAYCLWALADGVTSATEGESVFLLLQEETELYTFNPETDVTANCEDLYYMGTLDEDGELHIYELIMPAHDVTINIETSSTVMEGNFHWRDTISLGETKTITIPRPELAIDENWVYFTQEFTFVPEEDGTYRFLVSYEEDKTDPYYFTVDVTTAYWQLENGIEFEGKAGEVYDLYFQYPNHDGRYPEFSFCVVTYNPVTVAVETGIGGSAFTDVDAAILGDTVNLYCYPDEGYRVAQITGVDGLMDNGDGTYTFTMPDKAVDIKVLFLREENPFLDVNETHFFYDPVLWAVEEGITSGMTPETFGPFGVCNRAQVVTFLWRYAGSPEPTITENPFTDVPAESWYTKAVLWAVENGITKGVSATQFGPNSACNRAQVVTFLWRLMEEPTPAQSEHPFTDVDTGSFYELPVLWALENGITTGATATTFNPNGQCQRAQVVTFLYRADQIPEPEPEVPTDPTDPTEPSKPSKTYVLDLRTNGNGEVAYVDNIDAAPGESIFFYAVPNPGFYLDHVGIFNPDGLIDVSQIQIIDHGDDLYELIMIPFDLIMTCHFYPIP